MNLVSSVRSLDGGHRHGLVRWIPLLLRIGDALGIRIMDGLLLKESRLLETDGEWNRFNLGLDILRIIGSVGLGWRSS